jgi:hypothetical protein
MVHDVHYFVAYNQEERQDHRYNRQIQHGCQPLVPHLGGR